MNSFVHTKKTCPICILILFHLDVVIREGVNIRMCLNYHFTLYCGSAEQRDILLYSTQKDQDKHIWFVKVSDVKRKSISRNFSFNYKINILWKWCFRDIWNKNAHHIVRFALVTIVSSSMYLPWTVHDFFNRSVLWTQHISHLSCSYEGTEG